MHACLPSAWSAAKICQPVTRSYEQLKWAPIALAMLLAAVPLTTQDGVLDIVPFSMLFHGFYFGECCGEAGVTNTVRRPLLPQPDTCVPTVARCGSCERVRRFRFVQPPLSASACGAHGRGGSVLNDSLRADDRSGDGHCVRRRLALCRARVPADHLHSVLLHHAPRGRRNVCGAGC